MKKLINEYAASVAARAVAAHAAPLSMPGEGPTPILVAASRREAEALNALENAIMWASEYLSHALIEVEAISAAQPVKYADDPSITEGYRANFDRKFNSRRAFTLKDAKPRARVSEHYLRKAWELLDPSST